VVVCAVALPACGSGSEVHRAVPEPPGAKVATTVDDGPRSWALLQDGDCVLLRVSARGRRYLSEPACPYGTFTNTLRVEEPEVRFNDRDVRYEPCHGDCAGLPPDVTMSTPVVWGMVAPGVGFACVDTASGPVVARASPDGLVLAPVPADVNRMPDEPLPFLPDGRFAGWEGPGQEAKIAACQAAGAPGSHPPESRSWPLRIELPRDLEDRDPALRVLSVTEPSIRTRT
jgi:hypothetical protein